MQGITDALRKTHLVASALESFSSETQFLAWYDDVILEKNVIKNDLMTFGEGDSKSRERILGWIHKASSTARQEQC